MRARFISIDFMDLKGRLGSRDDGSEVGHDDVMIKRMEMNELEMVIKCQFIVNGLMLQICRRFSKFYTGDCNGTAKN